MSVSERRDWLIEHQKRGWGMFAVGFGVVVAIPLGLASQQSPATIAGATFTAVVLVFAGGVWIFRRLLPDKDRHRSTDQ
ncbi:MAG: hypothetical protein JWO88_3658 [Frankiales bacterium]|nr:hypothetical protein [Frankiales bacterium]